MLFVSASDLSPAELSHLGNNILPGRRKHRRTPDERENRRVLSAVNRSLSSLAERVDRLYPAKAVIVPKATIAPKALAS
jgi:hypothetical protein